MFLREVVCEGDTVIDATAGNGHDTIFLASLVGESGRVHAFDIQACAIESAHAAAIAAGCADHVTFHHTCHTGMGEHVSPESASAIMFNLGYLPGHDHEITTTSEETLDALATAASLLRNGGVLSVVCYPGHHEGKDESTEVSQWFENLPAQGWRVARYAMLGTKSPAPFLLVGRKK